MLLLGIILSIKYPVNNGAITLNNDNNINEIIPTIKNFITLLYLNKYFIISQIPLNSTCKIQLRIPEMIVYIA